MGPLEQRHAGIEIFHSFGATESKPPDDEKWQSLGVFAMVQGDDTTSYNLFQLAINKDGVIRGNYYNTLTDSAEPVAGSVDRKTQRAAWTVGGRKSPVYEAGIANLTKEETTMLLHFGKEKTLRLFFGPAPLPAF